MAYISKLWKQDRLPVWHAGFSESTIYKIESESQSTNILYTGWTLPDSSPFIHSLLRDVLQNHALPVLIVLASASLLAYASIRMSLVFLSCTTTGRSPLRFSKSMSLSDLAFMPIWQWTGTEINLAIWDSIINRHKIKNTTASTATEENKAIVRCCYKGLANRWWIEEISVICPF